MIDYQRGVTEYTMRKTFIFDWAMRNGRVSELSGGYDMRRNVGVDVIKSEPYVRMQLPTWQTDQLERQQNFAPRACIGKTALDILDNIYIQGENAIINLGKKRMLDVLNGLRQDITRAIFLDGSDSANAHWPEGLETFLGKDSTYAVTNTDLVAIPGVSYAGLSTSPGAESTAGDPGAGSGEALNAAFYTAKASIWPDGDHPFLFDYYSPTLVNAGCHLSSDSGDQGWKNTATRITRRAFQFLTAKGGDDSTPTLGIFGRALFREFKDELSLRTREIVPHVPEREMGFPGSINFEGAVLKDDYYCPSRTGYLLNPKAFEFYHMRRPAPNPMFPDTSFKSGIFFGAGPVPIPPGLQSVYLAMFVGGIKWHPKFVCKIFEYAT
jgi:hypothetical protein